jgi:hypothetical protein
MSAMATELIAGHGADTRWWRWLGWCDLLGISFSLVGSNFFRRRFRLEQQLHPIIAQAHRDIFSQNDGGFRCQAFLAHPHAVSRVHVGDVIASVGFALDLDVVARSHCPLQHNRPVGRTPDGDNRLIEVGDEGRQIAVKKHQPIIFRRGFILRARQIFIND